jgi:outer membrane protein OmpA-like peptidoglycan-associated protein
MYDEQNPVLSPDGRTMFITIANHPQNIGGIKDSGDIWISELTAEGWSAPVHGGINLNNLLFNGVAAISDDGNDLYLLSHYKPNGSTPTTQGLSVAHKTNSGWSTPENISIPYFVNRSTSLTGQYNINASAIIIAAESYGTLGAEDIYVSINENGRWSELKNLGRTINTHFQEMSPYLDNEGKKLYYASNGKQGFGSFDIFVSERLDDSWTNWSEPKNLGSMINSEGRELYFRPIPQFGLSLYTSTRNSDGYGDIHIIIDSIKNIQPVEIVSKPVEIETNVEETKSFLITINGRVTNAKSGQLIPATIKFRADTIRATAEASNGNYNLKISPAKFYSIEVESKGYVNLSERLDIQSMDLNTVEMNFKLQPIEVGAVVNLKSVLFEIGSTTLLDESYDELNVVVDFLKNNPKVEIELDGHTDNRGDAKKNLVLSQQRVDKIKDYLVSKGISGRRIKGKGYGGSRPVATNNTEEARRLNRRVEFRILKD